MGSAIRHATTRQTTAAQAWHSNWLLLAALVVAALALAERPGATAIPAVPTSPTRDLQLQIGNAGSYRLDGKPVTRDRLEDALRVARGQSPQLRLRIDAGNNDPQQLIGALALADHAGIRNIGSRVQ